MGARGGRETNMNFLTDLIPTLMVLGVLILVHEWGHFIACRLTKVRVEKFSIGFGPELIHFQGKETRYAISLFPFGGFVKPSGESLSEVEGGALRPYDFLAASVGKRVLIVTAGVAMNYLLSFLLFLTIFLAGRPIPLAQIGDFVEGYPAASSGLAKGDRIIAVGNIPVHSWEDLTEKLSQISTPEANLKIERSGRVKTVNLPLRVETVKDIFGETHQIRRLGIKPDPEALETERLSFGAALREAFWTEVHLTAMTYKGFYYLVTGRLSLKTISGPIGIMTMTGVAAKMGVIYVLHLTAVLGISLAVINLLPIPALDGGHLLFLLIEVIQGRRVSLQFQERVTQIGFALLMLLMVFVLYNDLVNLQIFDRLKLVLGR